MGIVAVNTEQVLFISVPITGALAMDTHLPVAELVAVALATQPIRLSKINQFTGDKSQFVTVYQVVAVGTPALAFGMMKHDLCVVLGQHPPLRIGFQVGMALVTGEDPLGKRGTWYRKSLLLRAILNVVGGLLFSSRLFGDNQLAGAIKFLYSGGRHYSYEQTK